MNDRYWDSQVETLPAERRQLLQDHRLRWQVRRCWDGSPFYRARLEAAGLDPATFGGLADLSALPILRLGELPRGDGADVPSRDWTVAPEAWWQGRERFDDGLVRVLTDGDVTQRAHLAARALWAAGVRPGRSLAAMSTEGPPPDVVALPNVAPTVGYACGEAEGVHWADDQLMIEIVDPETGQAAERGGVGAVVVTDLAREGSPLIRFWTGLEAALIDEPCPCGRTSARSPFVRPLA